MSLNLNYTKAQDEVFFSPAPRRFTIVAKGRRVGLTRGAAQAFIEYCLTKQQRLLWGETIFSNVQRYFDLYFQPILDQLPKNAWSWRAKIMQLELMGSIVDFRSADSPETWEGFGYNLIFLNEAGIILRNPELYKKTVLPMLMDYPDSRLIAAGVPKGKKLKTGEIHPFYQLWEKAESDPAYIRYKFSSFTNPFLRAQDVQEISDVLDQQMRLQEIYGEFIDQTQNPYLYEFNEPRHVTDQTYTPNPSLPLWFSLDFNISPNSCIVGQQPDQYSLTVFDEISINGSTEEVCKVLLARYSHWINRGIVFVVGDATGKNRNAMSGELTNYIVIKKTLGLRDSQMKVKQVNNLLDSSRVICNSILNKGEVMITKNCQITISDCQLAEVDMGGQLIKISGLHKFDCFRYLLEGVFPDFLKHGDKYLRPKKGPEIYVPQLYRR